MTGRRPGTSGGRSGQAEEWRKSDARQAAWLAQMRAEGIDPNDAGPPPRFNGKWPSFAQATLL